MVDDFSSALFVDIAVVITCIFLLVRFGDLRFSHPATPYIVFHVHTVTTRLAGIMQGADLMFARGNHLFEEVAPAEIIRAVTYCDIAFCAATASWILFAVYSRNAPKPPPSQLMLEPRLLRPILLLAFVGGIVGVRLVALIPGVEMVALSPDSSWSSSSYLYILPSWFGLAVLGYAYYYGFGMTSMALNAGYLVLMALQGSSRFRVIIGVLMTVQIVMERANRRWPSRTMFVTLGIAAMLFFPMKQIAAQIYAGEDVGKIADSAADTMTELSEGASPDQKFLDEFACALTLLDLQGKKYMGSTFLPLLTLAIPRALWRDKPTLSGYVADISTRTRPMRANGMIATYLGESYANFGLVGIFVMPPLIALLLAIFHRRARASAHHSVLRFAYVLVCVNLVQVYRDGLESLFVFVFVNMMPMTVIVLAHLVRSIAKRKSLVPHVRPVRPEWVQSDQSASEALGAESPPGTI
jgi:O-antigen polysaccharide polymerase Wzy